MHTYLPLSAFLDVVSIFRFKYRDRGVIVRDILETITDDPKGKTKTSIMRGANLNFQQVNKYLDFLVVCDIIRTTSPVRSQELGRYRLTQKGLRFLRSTEMWNMAMYAYQHRPL